MLIAALGVVIAIGTGAMNTVQSVSVIVVVTVLVGISLVGLTTMDASNLAPSSYPQVASDTSEGLIGSNGEPACQINGTRVAVSVIGL